MLFRSPIISVAVGLVIFLARIPVADVLKDTFNVVGGMNTPLSMIITGITISQFQLLSILKDKRVYFTVILRMFIIPVICTLVMYLIHARGMVAVITIILEACPCAAITTLFAIKFGQVKENSADNSQHYDESDRLIFKDAHGRKG